MFKIQSEYSLGTDLSVDLKNIPVIPFEKRKLLLYPVKRWLVWSNNDVSFDLSHQLAIPNFEKTKQKWHIK